ncbi:hypothetical protein ABB27_07150 [Stenotrophomonas terrae]|uniref:Uncharacterized protein n=1 Tax=Stenotrophomonas terrae TaxID=405446 RepID=A0A0R0CQH1_9GAMM|nr:hypothetical protein ABB27_07150 [Stenotrophomonas terrae]
MILFAASLLALVVMAVWFLNARSALSQAYGLLGNAKQALSEAQVREQEAQLKVKQAQSAIDLLNAADQQGFQPADWGERLVNLRQVQMNREDTTALIGSVTRSNQRVFGAEAFELSVTHPDEGLFDVPSAVERVPAPLSLTLRGSALFRTTALSGSAIELQGGVQ